MKKQSEKKAQEERAGTPVSGEAGSRLQEAVAAKAALDGIHATWRSVASFARDQCSVSGNVRETALNSRART